ncbi:MAG: VOC family protein [Defluviitaleaceae bacterium]|nr:VOC family protein [Defluviitaleaceae bacterium]
MFSAQLDFSGNAEEALKFYAKVFKHQLKDADVYRNEDGTILHSDIDVFGSKLMMADGASSSSFQGFSFAVNLTDEAEIRRIYLELSDGAEISIPLGEVEFSKCYGALKDKFGVAWQVCLDYSESS